MWIVLAQSMRRMRWRSNKYREESEIEREREEEAQMVINMKTKENYIANKIHK